MPIPLGILAAAGVRPAVAAGAYELIETITVGSGGAASVTFSNLNTYSTTYQHLQIRYVARSDRSGFALDELFMRFNGDSANNYAAHFLYGTGSGVASAASTSDNKIGLMGMHGATATASSFGVGVIDILDAYETKNKTIRSLVGLPAGGENQIRLTSGVWLNTNAVSSILLDQVTGPNFVQGSRFSLYGLKASA